MRTKRPTQRQLAAEGRAREIARFDAEISKRYDHDEKMCQAFVAGILAPSRVRGVPRATPEEAREWTENFIRKKQIDGTLLRDTLAAKLGKEGQ